MSKTTDSLRRVVFYVPNLIKRLWEVRQRISVRLYLAFGVGTLITLVASILAIVSINILSGVQAHVNEENVPKLLGAFSAAQLSSELVSAMPRLTSSTSELEFGYVVSDVSTTTGAFIQDLQQLEELFTDNDAIMAIRENGTELQINIDQVKDLMSDRFKLISRGEDITTQVQSLQTEAATILPPAIDDQLFFAMTGYQQMRGLEAQSPQRLTAGAVDEYRHLVTIQGSFNEATRLLSSVLRINNLHQVPPLSQEFDAAINRINRSATYIRSMEAKPALTELIREVTELGHGQQNSFQIRTTELVLIDQLTSLIDLNQGLVSELVSQVETLVANAKSDTEASTAQSENVAKLSEYVLIGYNVVTIVGAVLLAWLWVGRQLIDRIARLSGNMQTMASGNLEVEIDQSGADEVAHMATALEVFRKHALEVQRLNLVEKLAQELADKNETLERTNLELVQAQNQIVMREKLAALGELTAGVAHEIKNPMNFIINFSDVSKELIEELVEELENVSQDDSDAPTFDKELIEEICTDLSGNLERIAGHGQRANRIVVDMLSMGRGSTEWRPTNLNELINTHVNLAFHSQRGQDSAFQLKLDFDLDEAVGEVNVIPQDLGRVFLNITSNACHATDQRRKELVAKGSEPNYMPTLAISSRRTEDQIEIGFADNGPGMSKEVIEKIFQPFFTTKDPNEGTGLGMSLSHDIIRKHGGEIKLQTELGVGSTLTVVLPLDPSQSIGVVESEETVSPPGEMATSQE